MDLEFSSNPIALRFERCWGTCHILEQYDYTLRLNEVERAVYRFHLGRHVRSVSSTILVGSISYLHISSSNFRRCVACKVYFKIKNFWQILEIFNFDFVFFWLGIQYDSIEWVIMRRQGVFSERRRSSCSSFISTRFCRFEAIERSVNKTSYRLVNIGPGVAKFCVIEA